MGAKLTLCQLSCLMMPLLEMPGVQRDSPVMSQEGDAFFLLRGLRRNLPLLIP